MASTASLAREACRDGQRCVESRQRLHAHVDPWLNTLEARVKEPQPTWEALPPAVFLLRQAWPQGVPEGVGEQAPRARVEPRAMACPQGGPLLSARGPAVRPGETLVGASRRPAFDCERCQLGTAPLDAALELIERRKQAARPAAGRRQMDTRGALRARVRAGRGVARAAPAWASRPRGDSSGGRGGGVLEVAPTREAIAAPRAAVAAGQPWRPILVLAMDGAEVPPRLEPAKGRRRGRQQARAKRAPGAARQQVTTAGLIPEAQGRLWGMADGAPWLWHPVRAPFPAAIESLDDAHGGAHLSKVAARPDRPPLNGHPHGVRRLWRGAGGVKCLEASGGCRHLTPPRPRPQRRWPR
jgi:hypothetical protein